MRKLYAVALLCAVAFLAGCDDGRPGMEKWKNGATRILVDEDGYRYTVKHSDNNDGNIYTVDPLGDRVQVAKPGAVSNEVDTSDLPKAVKY